MSNTNTSNSTMSSWKSEFERRVNAFASKIKAPAESVFTVFSDYFGADGTDESSLEIIDRDEASPFGELRKAFCEDTKLTKIGLLRLGLPLLRATKQYQSVESDSGSNLLSDSIKQLVEQNRPIAKWSDKELIEKYADKNNDVRIELTVRSGSRPFLVYNDDGTLDITATEQLLKIARKQPTDEIAMVNGSPKVAHRAGYYYEEAIDESPVQHGKCLVNGYCGASGTDWNGVETKMRQAVRVLVDNWTTRPTISEFQAFREAAVTEETFFKKYPMIMKKFKELESTGSLPKLKISPTAQQDKKKVDSGFVSGS